MLDKERRKITRDTKLFQKLFLLDIASMESTIIISNYMRSYFYFGYVCIIIIATVVGIDNFILSFLFMQPLYTNGPYLTSWRDNHWNCHVITAIKCRIIAP